MSTCILHEFDSATGVCRYCGKHEVDMTYTSPASVSLLSRTASAAIKWIDTGAHFNDCYGVPRPPGSTFVGVCRENHPNPEGATYCRNCGKMLPKNYPRTPTPTPEKETRRDLHDLNKRIDGVRESLSKYRESLERELDDMRQTDRNLRMLIIIAFVCAFLTFIFRTLPK